MRKTGLFFGSFNPIHIGHLILANAMVQSGEVDEVWFVVSPHNPFKKKSTLLHEFDRLDMVQAAIDKNYNFKATDIEFRMPKPSYTVDTLVYLSEKHPQHDFKVIVGEDNLEGFRKWKNHHIILEDYGLLVYPRPHAKTSDLKDHENVKLIEAPMVDISATYIRKSIQAKKDIRYMVPDGVRELIESKGFYKG
ncbi:nicotinate-nucleotide adenylyltransferase [Flammeovirga yaeyamensis]|uniref:Probable nicotinate-nucleotide adenylyltransferase n=1 Tax=Flammeovirga yaeyamensis TaxID=367791 RepID=A0AAX1N371_9BACT|nr:nicotinate (nicotinamide) nucleotide adenylyltransferase [Flammeovirga yaeyamensis]MBB3700563.1 nicotinate-nucleotide adenylyltransferase [Flammeovirga yaeyamensis]NMF37680.1 nicotinate-nucleotide adenylyltransferase [Flammeovirga yaeyamensis]QWG01989.1 nicotinate-nucleotide adenylyltransferase [Flammeovirga yaeyamensis]